MPPASGTAPHAARGLPARPDTLCHAAVLGAALVAACLATPAPAADDGAAEAFFERAVRPLLAAKCLGCHSGAKAGGGLLLDSREGWRAGGDGGAVIVPGEPQASRLVAAIGWADEGLRMPPEEAGGRLTDAEIEVLVTWVRDGAVDPRHAAARVGGMTPAEAAGWWAFQPLPPADAPATAERIDRFLLDALAAAGLEPAPPADARTLVRRLTYDLTGLPPSPEEIEAFAAAPSEAAWEALVERLLASPQHGVQQGRRWLDVVRYADTAGENTDRPLPHAWRYRNWVFESFAAGLPFDRFARLQIAGDILAADAPPIERASGIVATGYLAVARRFGHDIDKDVHLMHEDVIDNLGKAFLGLSLACARCHDHKYDPVSARDYYALSGIFASTRFAFPGCEAKGQPRDAVPLLPAAEVEALLGPHRERVAARDAEVARRKAAAEAAAAEGREPPAEAPLPDPGPAPVIPVAYAVAEGPPRDVALAQRGDPEQPGEVVPRRWLEVFGATPLSDGAGSGRRELAEWIVRQPLFARVAVNRIWQWHFGAGLVRSPNDFGTRGERPTHPELLDWLAARFVASGYDVKGLSRLLVTTRAWRQASAASAAALAADPDNRLLSRFTRRRLTAEELRDGLLAVAGALDTSPAEAHPFPPEAGWTFTQHAPFTAVYDTPKRAAYLMVQRQRRHPFLALFDGADPNASSPRREASTVPTQALWFLNDPFFHAQAAELARRTADTADPAARAGRMFALALGRQPDAAEREAALALAAPRSDRPDGDFEALARVLLSSAEFLHLD